MSDDRVSAVQFVRFPLEDLDAAGMIELAGRGEIVIEVDHPATAARSAFSPSLGGAPAEDLRQA